MKITLVGVASSPVTKGHPQQTTTVLFDAEGIGLTSLQFTCDHKFWQSQFAEPRRVVVTAELCESGEKVGLLELAPDPFISDSSGGGLITVVGKLIDDCKFEEFETTFSIDLEVMSSKKYVWDIHCRNDDLRTKAYTALHKGDQVVLQTYPSAMYVKDERVTLRDIDWFCKL